MYKSASNKFIHVHEKEILFIKVYENLDYVSKVRL